MTSTNKLQSIFCYIVIRATRNQGISSVNLGVAIDGKHDRIPLGIFWPTEFFDKINSRLLPRSKSDIECHQHNLIIEKNLAVANQIRLQIYAFPHKITTIEFKQRFRTFDSRESFIQFMESKINELYSKNLIKKHTRDNNSAVLNKLLDYKKSKGWSFAEVRASDLQLYFNWCLTQGKLDKSNEGEARRGPLAYNTVIGHFKVIAKYFNLAKEDKIQFENPFDNFEIGNYEPGIREVIDANELRLLFKIRKNKHLSPDQKKVLDKFLFACFTGLRKSDIEQVRPRKHLSNGLLTINPVKTAQFGKRVDIKLPKQALEILDDYREGFGFHESSLLNKSIKVIAAKAGINKYIKFHSSRDCFAVLYLKFGGNIADLKDLLGHKRISTTEIYLKMGSDAKNDTMGKFDLI